MPSSPARADATAPCIQVEIMMGLFDQITSALGGQDGGQGNLMQVVMQLVQNHPGGLQGLMDQFSQAGLAQHVQSWIGTGSNLPVSGAGIAKVFSGGQ